MSDSPAKSPAKSKKPASKKKPANHPPYFEMIAAAITALKEPTGSSTQAIVDYISANFKVGENFAKHVKLALKRGVTVGALRRIKHAEELESFKIAEKPKSKKPAGKKHVRRSIENNSMMKSEINPLTNTTARGDRYSSNMLTNNASFQGNHLKAGVIAGIVVPLVFIVLFTVLIICYIKRRKSTRKTTAKSIGNKKEKVQGIHVNAVLQA